MNLSKRLALGGVFVLLAFSFLVPASGRHKSDEAKARAAVKITRLDERSGGTGVVLSSSTTESKVLTNNHVCGVVEHGGIVSNNYGRGFVTSFIRSEIHDLCLITVAANFHTKTTLADEPPKLTTIAAVSGFPKLMPNIITRGSFGDHQIVSIMIGMKPCTVEDMASPDPTVGLICAFVGGLPIIRNYDAQFTGATIQPGNSGSAVYNEAGELSGLVFAGSGDLSYGLIVPYEFLVNFLTREIPNSNLTRNLPNTTFTLGGSSTQESKSFNKACQKYRQGNENYSFMEKWCNSLNQDLIYNKD